MGSFISRPESIFAPTPLLHTLIHHPLTYLFTTLHTLLLNLRGSPLRTPQNQIPIRIVAISDTHSKIPSQALPKGDLLIHCGDLTNTGTLSTIQQSIDWLKTVQKPWPGSSDGYRYIVVIAGNHDSYFDPRSRSAHDSRTAKTRKLDWGKIIYLQHGHVTLTFPGDRKLNIYGAPQIPKCGGKEFAFQYERGQDAWTGTVPDETDILVTHNPPKWHLDIPENGGLGDEFELREVWRVKPTVHVFGHVHSGYGREYIWWDEGMRAVEGIRERAFGSGIPPRETILTGLIEMFDLVMWMMGFKMLVADLKGVLWNRVWGGARNGSIMVNAALTYQTSEQLRNKPQLVVL